MLPFTNPILRPLFLSVPFELEEAVQLDGSERFRTFTHVIFPLARNGVSVVAVLVFIDS